MIKKIAIGSLVFFSIFGIYLFTIFAHEGLHVVHAKGAAKSVCVDFNLKMNDEVQSGYVTAHTVFDTSKWKNLEEFNTFREFTEKWAAVLQAILPITLAFVVGLLVSKLRD